MNTWLTIRAFCALFLVVFGTGLMFVRSEDARLILGSALAAVGLTFMLRLAVALREN